MPWGGGVEHTIAGMGNRSRRGGLDKHEVNNRQR